MLQLVSHFAVYIYDIYLNIYMYIYTDKRISIYILYIHIHIYISHIALYNIYTPYITYKHTECICLLLFYVLATSKVISGRASRCVCREWCVWVYTPVAFSMHLNLLVIYVVVCIFIYLPSHTNVYMAYMWLCSW